MRQFNQQELEAAVQRHREYLDSLVRSHAIVGYGVGLDAGGRLTVKVHGDSTPADVRDQIKQRFGEHPVTVEDHGEARLQSG